MLQAVIVFDLAHLLAHACASQGLVIGKGHANPIALRVFLAPGDIAGVVPGHLGLACTCRPPCLVASLCRCCMRRHRG